MKLISLWLKSLLILSCLFSITAWGAANIITVAKFGGDYTNPLHAVGSIFDASRGNPYVVFVAPGKYQLGTTPLYMKPHVSLVGSGQKATYIIGRVDSAALIPFGGPGVINGADASEIRQLTVINRNFGTAHAIHNLNASPLISNVTAIARGGGGSGAFKAGIWDDGNSRSRLDRVTAHGLGAGGASPCFGLFSRNSVTRVQQSRLVANGCSINNGIAVSEGGRVVVSDSRIIARNSSSGFDNGVAVTAQLGIDANIKIRNSIIRGALLAANVDSSSALARIRIAGSEVDGPANPGTSGEIKCFGAYDSGFDPLDSSCSP